MGSFEYLVWSLLPASNTDLRKLRSRMRKLSAERKQVAAKLRRAETRIVELEGEVAEAVRRTGLEADVHQDAVRSWNEDQREYKSRISLLEDEREWFVLRMADVKEFVEHQSKMRSVDAEEAKQRAKRRLEGRE